MPFTAETIGTAGVGTFTAGTFSDTYNEFGAGVAMVALDLVAGNLYEIDGDGTSGDAYIRVFDALGNEVKANDDGFDAGEVVGLDFFSRFIPNYSGRYYFSVSNIETIDYDPFTTAGRQNPPNFIATAIGTLVVTDLGPSFDAGYPDDNSTAIGTKGVADETDAAADSDRQIRVAYNTITSVGSADVEFARFDLVKGDRLVIDVNGFLGLGDDVDTVLRVFNAAGAAVASAFDTGFSRDAELVFVAPSTGSFFFGVSGNGNAAYAADGSGTTASDAGDFRVVIHRNPDQIGSSVASDSLVGGGGGNYLIGLAGNDTLRGNGGEDTLAGGDENDTLDGGLDNDVLYGESGADTLNGGKGNDVLVGGEGNDSLLGLDGNDVLEGGDGSDTLAGGKGIDTLRGGAGADNLSGADQGDSLFGDGFNDTLSGGVGNDLVDGGEGNDIANGDDGNDVVLGGVGIDTLGGGTGNDNLDGGADADRADGGDGNDVVAGGSGDDTLLGGLGADTLVGGFGVDRLTGGVEAGVRDVFRFASVGEGLDTLLDFQRTIDVIDLSAIFDATGSSVNAGNLSQFVQTSPSGGGTDAFLGIDANGAVGGLSFTIVAQVNGITAAQLFDASNFLL